MKITSLELKNFKNFGDYTFDRFDTNGLTAITGDCGSGKTLLIKAVAFVLGASLETLHIQNLSALMKCWTYDSSVKLTLLVDRNRVVTLEKRITGYRCKCFFNQKQVREKTYMKKLEELKIRDQHFFPIFNETINRLPKKEEEYANFFEIITGTNEEGRECDNDREKLEQETRTLEAYKNHRSVIDMERCKTTDLYLARLFFYDEKIRLKENEIVEEKKNKKNPRKLKTAAGGLKVSPTKTMKKGRASNSNSVEKSKSVAALEDEKFQLYAQRHFNMRQCQINNIPFPTDSQVVSVLSSEELRCVNDPTSIHSAALLEEKHRFTYEEVENGMQVVINHDVFKKKFLKTPSVEMANSYCNMAYNELQQIKGDLPEDFKYMPLIKKEAICKKTIDEKEFQIDALEEKIRDLIVQRRNSFLDFFDAVATQLDQEYKDLWGNNETKGASIEVADRENPWDCVIIKVKEGYLKLPFRSANVEAQKMANIALVFAMAKVKGSPFVLIDGVTEHTVQWGFDRLISYLKKKSETFQVVTTSVTSTFHQYLRQAGVAAQEI